MITIYASTGREYDQMMEFAQDYLCRQLPARTCAGYAPDRCDNCYKDNHVEYGISVFRTIDDKEDI